MVRRFSVNYAIFSMALDFAAIAAMLSLNEKIRPFLDTYLPVTHLAQQSLTLSPLLYLTFPFTWVSIMAFFSVYDGRKNLRIVDEYTNITMGSLLAGIALAGILYFTYREVSRALFITFGLSSYLALLIWRILARPIYMQWHQGVERIRHILVVGAGPVGQEFEKRMNQYADSGIQWVGFLDDDPQKRSARPDILGPLSSARNVVENKHVDDVVIALPRRAYDRVNEVVETLRDLPVNIWVVPDYFQISLHQAKLTDFAGLPMLDLNAPAISDYQRMVKRIFDLLVIGMLSLPSLLVMSLIALFILITDGQPILYKQKRVGENGRIFTLYKFRTMIPGADAMLAQVAKVDQHGNTIYKLKGDPRVTPLGSFLRRTSLDELPQLFNILNGDMSLVGPRPELPELVQNYRPWQRERFAIPQGLTGWWQIHGRSDKPMYLNTEQDLYYVKNYSFWLDIYILMRTFWVVLRGKGAY